MELIAMQDASQLLVLYQLQNYVYVQCMTTKNSVPCKLLKWNMKFPDFVTVYIRKYFLPSQMQKIGNFVSVG